MRKIVVGAAAAVLALAGFGASLALSGLGEAASQALTFPVSICHPNEGVNNWSLLTFQNQNALDGHTNAAHPNGPDVIPADSRCLPATTTKSTSTVSSSTTTTTKPTTTTTSTTTTKEDEFSVTICHPEGNGGYTKITFTNANGFAGHVNAAHPNGPDIILASKDDSCPGGTTTSTTTTSTTTTTKPTTTTQPTTTVKAPPPPNGLNCQLTKPQPSDPLELNTVAAGDTARTIAMEKDILVCKKGNDQAQIRDLETFIEVVQKAGANGLTTQSVNVHTALCTQDMQGGGVACARQNLGVSGSVSKPLAGCYPYDQQPGDPVQMNSKGVGAWFKTTKVEKTVYVCPNGSFAHLYVFTDIVSPNPPTTAASTTKFYGVVCYLDPTTGTPPWKCNTVTVF